VIPVVAAVIRRGNRFLLALRRQEKRHGGCWEFPGGKLGEGETEREALSRELREELGVVLTGVGDCLFTAMDPGSPFRVRFWETRVEGEPEPLEHSEVRWTTVEEAEGLPLAPADASFLRAGPDEEG
jgi:8-oxo-dGTP diphosphatase